MPPPPSHAHTHSNLFFYPSLLAVGGIARKCDPRKVRGHPGGRNPIDVRDNSRNRSLAAVTSRLCCVWGLDLPSQRTRVSSLFYVTRVLSGRAVRCFVLCRAVWWVCFLCLPLASSGRCSRARAFELLQSPRDATCHLILN